MGQPFIGEIRMVGFNFAPAGWAMCDGQTLPISQNDALFNLLGTLYGGDGQETFNLPNLQSRIPMHQGTLGGITYTISEMDGVESVTLTTQQLPIHNHPAIGVNASGNSANPQGCVWAGSNARQYSNNNAANGQMATQSMLPTGGSQPHDNMVPYLVITFIISLFGLYPHQ